MIRNVFCYLIKHRFFLVILFIGVLIRVIVMPFTLHHDILCSAWRVSLGIYKNVWQLPYFSEIFLSGFFFTIKSLLLHLKDIVIINGQNAFSITADSSVYYNFIHSPYSHRLLFLLKTPYLIADIILIAFINKYLKPNSSVMWFWALSPFVIYSVFMWGRYEIFPILLTVIAFYFIDKHKTSKQSYAALFLLGLAMSFRISFILYIPFAILYLYKKPKEIPLLLLITFLPVFITNQLVRFSGGGRTISEYVNIIFEGKIGAEGYAMNIFIVSFIIMLVCAYFWKVNKKFTINRFIFCQVSLLLTFYAFTTFYPQYIAWITPIAFLLINKIPKLIFWFLGLFFVFLVYVDLYFGCYTSVCLLFESTLPDFAHSLSTIRNQYAINLDDITIINIVNSIFVALCLSIIIITWKYINGQKHK